MTLGIDIGTTSVKAVAADADGTVVARARVPHQVRSRVAGEFEHDVDEAWRDGVVAALTQVAEGLDVAAVNVSAMVPSLGAVDAEGRGVGPGLLYGDHRGERDDADPTQPGDSGELLAFLAWQAATHPEAAGYWPAQAVANHALTGRGAIDSTTAMTAHPLFDFVGWDEALAADAGTTPAALPDIVSGVEPAGRIRDGLVGGGRAGGRRDDRRDGRADRRRRRRGRRRARHLRRHAHHVGRRRRVGRGPGPLDHPPHGRRHDDGRRPEQRRRALRRPGAPLGGRSGSCAGRGGRPDDLPVWLPYVRGERTPLHRRDIRGQRPRPLAPPRARAPDGRRLRGVRPSSPATTSTSARQAGLAPRRIVATGGGTNAAAWMQALADVTQLPVDVVAVPEGAALGSAFIARCVAGLEQNMTDARRWARTSRTVEPRGERPCRTATRGFGRSRPTRWRRQRLRAGTRSAASRP